MDLPHMHKVPRCTRLRWLSPVKRIQFKAIIFISHKLRVHIYIITKASQFPLRSHARYNIQSQVSLQTWEISIKNKATGLTGDESCYFKPVTQSEVSLYLWHDHSSDNQEGSAYLINLSLTRFKFFLWQRMVLNTDSHIVILHMY